MRELNISNARGFAPSWKPLDKDLQTFHVIAFLVMNYFIHTDNIKCCC